MARPFDIQGHRGARALFPENTLEGFLATAALGVTAFELDVGLTADAIPVVSHDPALNADITRNPSGTWLAGSGPALHSLTLAELLQFDVGRLRPGSATATLFPDQKPRDGARVPTLAAVLSALPDARFTIEIKTDPMRPDLTASPVQLAEATIAVIDQAGATGRVMIESFDWRIQRYVRRIRPDITLAWLTRPQTVRDSAVWWDGTGTPVSIPAAVAAEGGPVWAPDHSSLTKAEIADAHALGLSVLPWTVNRPDDMRRLINWGVDGLISDRPDIAMSLAGVG